MIDGEVKVFTNLSTGYKGDWMVKNIMDFVSEPVTTDFFENELVLGLSNWKGKIVFIHNVVIKIVFMFLIDYQNQIMIKSLYFRFLNLIICKELKGKKNKKN